MCINKRTAAVITPNLRMDVCFVWACICILVRAYECIYIYIYLNLLMWLGAYLCLCVCVHTRLLCVCLLLLLCLCACGLAGMEHGHLATKLNSQKRAWAWPAEQYLDSVFMRWTTTAISITALWFMFVCFAQRWSDSIKKLLFSLLPAFCRNVHDIAAQSFISRLSLELTKHAVVSIEKMWH